MSLTSHPAETAGNIPLILLASDVDSLTHPLVRPAFIDQPARPCLASSELKSFPTAQKFALWLPTPTLKNHKTRRNLFVAWKLDSVAANPEDFIASIKGPTFQVCALSQPSRPGTGDTKFSSWSPQARTLSAVIGGDTFGYGTTTVATEIRDIIVPADAPAPLTEDALCYLLVSLPCKTVALNSLKFWLLGLGLDQW